MLVTKMVMESIHQLRLQQIVLLSSTSRMDLEAGNLQSLRIDQDGEIYGVFTNGLERKLAAIALATFENNDGLQKAGKNMFYSTVESGPAKIGLPQNSG